MYIAKSREHSLYKLLRILFPFEIKIREPVKDKNTEEMLSRIVLALARHIGEFFPKTTEIQISRIGLSFLAPGRNISVTCYPETRRIGIWASTLFKHLAELELPCVLDVRTNAKILSKIIPELAEACESKAVKKTLLSFLGIVNDLSKVSLPYIEKITLDYDVTPIRNDSTEPPYRSCSSPLEEIDHPVFRDLLGMISRPLFVGATLASHIAEIPVNKLERILETLSLALNNLKNRGFGFAEIYTIEKLFRFLYPRDKLHVVVTPLDKPEATIWIYPRYITESYVDFCPATSIEYGDFEIRVKIPVTDVLFTKYVEDLQQALEKANEILSALGRRDKHRELVKKIKDLEEYYRNRYGLERTLLPIT